MQTLEIYTRADVDELLSHAKGFLKTFLYIAFYSGARAGEILALRWRDVDFKDGFLSITATRYQNGDIDTPKNGKTRRIYLLEPLRAYLARFLVRDKDAFIVSQNYQRVNRAYRELLSRLGFDDTGLHSTRRTFIRQMLKKGVELDLIAFMVGHSDLTMIMQVYHGLIKDGNEKNTLENALKFS